MAARFPEEIWLQIVDCLRLPEAQTMAIENVPNADYRHYAGIDVHENLAALSRLCRCSREMYRITMPVLFSVLPGQKLVDATAFVASLFTGDRPRDLVREMVIDVAWGTRPGSQAPAAILVNALPRFQEVLDACDFLPVQLRGDIEDAIEQDQSSNEYDAGGVLSVMVLVSRKLECLNFICNLSFPYSILCRTLQSIADEHSKRGLANTSQSLRNLPLGKLRTLTACKDATSWYLGPERSIVPLLRLPSLRTLKLLRYDLSELQKGNNVGDKLLLPNIKEAMLLPDSEEDSATAIMGAICPNMTSFVLREDYEGFLTMRTVGDWLRQHGAALEHLTIIQHTAPHYSVSSLSLNAHELSIHGLGSLVSLSNLQTLCTTGGVLIPNTLPAIYREMGLDARRGHLYDILPVSLRALTILDGFGGGVVAMRPKTVVEDVVGKEIGKLMSSRKFRYLETVQFEVGSTVENDLACPGWTSRMMHKGKMNVYAYCRRRDEAAISESANIGTAELAEALPSV